MELSKGELIRYDRHLILKDFGIQGQLALKRAKVLVVGAGGLGCPVLLYLSAAGVGELGIADHDVINESNLQRQVLYNESDVGQNKAETAKFHLQKKNRHVKISAITEKITSSNALKLISEYDVVVDGTDNFPTRYLLNDACLLLDKPLVYGSILTYEGQVSVFNTKSKEGRSANYRDLFPEPPNASAVPDCSQAGVLGVLPGLIGCLQANEVIKLITGIGETLAEKLLIVDSLTLEQYIIRFQKQPGVNVRELVDYEEFCGVNQRNLESLTTNKEPMKEVTVQELKEMMDGGKSFQLIDVREPHEFDICNLGGELIPQSEIPANVERISKDKQVVIHCRSGARSGNMIQWLEKNHNFENLYNLKGGILAWAREIDPEMPTY